jgi:D-aminopeptidase
MARARELGIRIGQGTPGPNNAITDVPHVRVGYATVVEGRDVRTGVTVILPFEGAGARFAGVHRLNGNGEMTGSHYIKEMGMLVSPVAITNTHSVGTVHQAIIAHSVRSGTVSGGFTAWALPVVAETWDGVLNDINGFHVRPEHVERALADARGGPIAEGNVGGGTGMLCHGFKGGTGTASRVVEQPAGGYTVGVLVQANYGSRSQLRVNGVPVGQEITPAEVPLPGRRDGDSGSIIVIVATDAPLIPTQCERLAQRAGLGIARVGGYGADTSGDLFLAFANGNRLHASEDPTIRTTAIEMLDNSVISPLFLATVEATEEAIVNALLQAETMEGANGKVAHRLPHERLLQVMANHGQPPSVGPAEQLQ